MTKTSSQILPKSLIRHGAATAADFFQLLKPRVMALVAFSGAIGLIVSPAPIHPFLGLVTLLMIALGGGAAGAINMWFDRDIDAKMTRTRNRPLPTQRIHPDDALGYGIIIAIGSVSWTALALNATTALLLGLAIVYYVGIYTMWLKRRTQQNIVIGGGAGAFPPLIGWAATGADLGLYPFVLFAIIFFWTPPHFWSLALYRSQDYAQAGVPMMPVISGLQTTRRHIVGYTIFLALLSLWPWQSGHAGLVYGVTALILGLIFIGLSIRLLVDHSNQAARSNFFFSIAYLYILFSALGIDAALNGNS